MASPFLRVVLLVCAVLLWNASGVGAAVPLDVPYSGGLFRFLLLEPGERGEFEDDDDSPSAFRLQPSEIASLITGAGYWSLMLGHSAANTSPLLIEVGTADEYDDNAAFSPTLESGPLAGYTRLAADRFGETGQDRSTALASVTIDHAQNPAGEWYTGPMASLPQNGDPSDLASTVLHELGHALGLAASVDETPSASPGAFLSSSALSLWTWGLRDVNGAAPQPGMVITDTNQGPNAFVTDGQTAYSGVYFTGAHVREVLNGARIAYASDPDGFKGTAAPIPGLPVNGWEPDEDGDFFPEFSHIELQNSLMSHQNYRNWNTFMEPELAAMQDVGLVLDRRNWCGYSIYNSGGPDSPRVFVNTTPYYARNAEGEWLEGVPNATPWGTGLHVYGSRNDVTQAADLLSSGAYGLGIRVDGSGNRITVAPNTRVHADSTGGTALLVAYGKEHSISLRGEAQAMGRGGIAARFDFGDNEMGNNVEYRGSWLRSTGDYDAGDGRWEIDPQGELPEELKVALVESFDVTGQLAGNAAAVYIGPNAWVKTVNIMRGASLEGNIISLWNPLDERLQYAAETGDSTTQLTTALRFGLLPDAAGAAADAPDPDFRLRYIGDIAGGNSIRMSVEGGTLSFNGWAEVLNVEVKENATLSGNADYALQQISDPNDPAVVVGGLFINAGSLAPGNSIGTIRISGDYRQTPTGRLVMEFDASGRTDCLENGTPCPPLSPRSGTANGSPTTVGSEPASRTKEARHSPLRLRCAIRTPPRSA